MANNQIVISRIQNRRGIRENLPQPLLPGEFALTVDTGELWIGTDPNQPPFGVRTYGSGAGDISSAETIADNQIVVAKYNDGTFGSVEFDALVAALTGDLTFTLTDEDILWDERNTVFIAADTSVNANNTILQIYQAVENSGSGGTLLYSYADVLATTYYVSLGALNDPTVSPVPPSYAFDPADGDFLFSIAGSNAEQGAMAARLINKIHGAQLVTTLSNLQVTTTGIGVGSSTFLNWVMYNNEASLPVAPTWVAANSPLTISADSVTDTMRVVAGEGISIDADTTEDYFRITNTYADIPTNEFTLLASQPAFTDSGVENLDFDIDAVSDVIFLDYSLNIGDGAAADNNYTAGGNMVVVGNKNVGSGTATLTDNQVEVRDETGDAFAGSTVLCANFDGTDGATTFTESARSEPAVFVGNAQLDTAQKNFGTASALFDGTGSDAIYFGNGADDWTAYTITTSTDFTVEAFVRLAALPADGEANGMSIIGHAFSDSTMWEMEIQNSGGTYQLRARRGNDGFTAGTIVPSINTWYHVAMQVRNAATSPILTVLFNGDRVAQDFSLGTLGFTGDMPVYIGQRDFVDDRPFNGHIDDVRYTKGVARYGSGLTYTVPASPLCAPPAPLEGDVNFQATYVPGSPNKIQIEYTNTFTSPVTLRVVRKRWMSY